MKTRTAVRIISFCLAGLLVAAGGLIKEKAYADRYRLELQNNYSKSLNELSSSINNISTTLNKARFVTGPEQISQIAAKLLGEAQSSKALLASLPYAEQLTVLNKFLSQVGNYAMSLSKTVIMGDSITSADTENIELLSRTAATVTAAVSNSQITYDNLDYWAKELDKSLGKEIDYTGISDSLTELEDELGDFPTLVYDGPYSDHILEKEPNLIKDEAEISQNDALKRAAEIAETDIFYLKLEEETEGKIPSFRFIGEGVTVSISRRGGHGVYMRKEREVADTLLSPQQALEKAKRYLYRTNLKGFLNTYYYLSEGVCVFSFAFLDGETICYTDLLKVGVAMDSGEIMLLEASGYITNHRTRAFETPSHTLEEAAALISPALKIKSTAVALIPTSGENEARCYEFACLSSDNQEILIYINVSTLKEEEILILLKTDGGTLVK